METISLISSPPSTTSPSTSSTIAPFQYSHFASIASVGKWKGVYDSTNIAADQPQDAASVSGFLAFVLWRSAYWTGQVSLVNKILIPMYWFKSAVFGRDISRF
jgi:NADH dehydrogenase FAD-containing subunit